MKRSSFHVASFVALLLFCAVVALWVRDRRTHDVIRLVTAGGALWEFRSDGGLAVVRAAPWRRRNDDDDAGPTHVAGAKPARRLFYSTGQVQVLLAKDARFKDQDAKYNTKQKRKLTSQAEWETAKLELEVERVRLTLSEDVIEQAVHPPSVPPSVTIASPAPADVKRAKGLGFYAGWGPAYAASDRREPLAWPPTAGPNAWNPVRLQFVHARYPTLALATGALPALWLARFARRRVAAARGRRRSRKGLCPQCGYDLKGNATDACPECGHGTRRP